jgi:hypothetical protein
LIALFDKGDDAHGDCLAAIQSFHGSLITTWPVLTEVFHFLDGPTERRALWDLIFRSALDVEAPLPNELQEIHRLMMKYADLPMDFADASLVTVAQRRNIRRVLTLDSHFRAYRPRHVHSFEIFP